MGLKWLANCNHKIVNKWNLYRISKNLGTMSNICYNWTNVMSSDSISGLRGWFSTWQSWSLTWKSDLRGWGHNLGAYSLLIGLSDVSFSLKEKVLIWKFDHLRLRAHLCACFLLLGSSDVSFLLKEKVLSWSVDLQGPRQVFVLVLFTQDL